MVKPNSIRGRLLLWLLIPLSLILVIGEFVDFHSADTPANDAYDHALVDTALVLAAHLRQDGGRVTVDISEQTALALRTVRRDRVFLSVFAADGTLIYGDRQPAPGIDLPQRNADAIFYDATYDHQSIRVATLRHDVGNQPVMIEVAETTRKRDDTARKIFWATFVPDTLNALVTIMIVIVGVKKGLRPVEDMRAQISARSANDLQAIAVESTPRELVPLVTAINRLFDRLAQAAATQQRFVSNAAHQLRTPLAGLQTQLELLANDKQLAADKEKIEHLLTATGRLTHLINQLLMLAKADPSGTLDIEMDRVDLKLLSEQTAESFVDPALARDIDLGFELDAVAVPGNSRLLREMLANLVDNALRYTPHGGTVTVRCGQRDNAAFLEVEDNGPGIPVDERERIFDRFYRLSGTTDEGCGLGLAIVKEIADLHGATLSVAAAQPQGALFRIVWPIEKTAKK